MITKGSVNKPTTAAEALADQGAVKPVVHLVARVGYLGSSNVPLDIAAVVRCCGIKLNGNAGEVWLMGHVGMASEPRSNHVIALGACAGQRSFNHRTFFVQHNRVRMLGVVR